MGMSGGTRIKSIQRGTISIAGASGSQTATITAVDVNKAELRNTGVQWDSGAGSADVKLTLTNGTTITATKLNSASGNPSQVGWEVTEWY